MRVALLTTYHQRDGLGTYAERLTEQLRARGDVVVVLAPRIPQGDGPIGWQPPRLWGGRRATMREAFTVARAIEEAAVDVVHFNVNLSLFSARFLVVLRALLARRGVPMLVTLHGRDGGDPLRRFAVWRIERALRGLDVVVHNDAHARELEGRGHERVHVIAHGMPILSGRPMLEARARLGLDAAGTVLTHFGFLIPHKGVLEMVRALAELRRRGLPRIDYWIAGAVFRTRESRRHFASLRREVETLGLGDRVHLTGEFVTTEEAQLAMQAADWVVLNYRHGSSQGTSGAVTHALASGRPVAVSSAPFFDDVRDAVHTLEGDLATALAAMLRDHALAERTISTAARRCDETSWTKAAARYAQLHRRLSG